MQGLMIWRAVLSLNMKLLSCKQISLVHLNAAVKWGQKIYAIEAILCLARILIKCFCAIVAIFQCWGVCWEYFAFASNSGPLIPCLPYAWKDIILEGVDLQHESFVSSRHLRRALKVHFLSCCLSCNKDKDYIFLRVCGVFNALALGPSLEKEVGETFLQLLVRLWLLLVKH